MIQKYSADAQPNPQPIRSNNMYPLSEKKKPLILQVHVHQIATNKHLVESIGQIQEKKNQ